MPQMDGDCRTGAAVNMTTNPVTPSSHVYLDPLID